MTCRRRGSGSRFGCLLSLWIRCGSSRRRPGLHCKRGIPVEKTNEETPHEPGGVASMRYGFTDPRDGSVGVQYSFRTQQAAQIGAEQAGVSRFQGHSPGGEVVQFYRDHEGQWRQGENEAEIERNQNPERFASVRVENVARLLRAGEEGLQVAKVPLSPELRQAFADMGVNPQRDRDERLQGGIEV